MFTEDGDPAEGVHEAPDLIDRVLEIAGMESTFAAQRFQRVDEMRREALVQTTTFRGAIPEIIERSLRLELATALRITESAADRMFLEADALVHRYPAVLDSLANARTTERHAQAFVELVDPVEPELLDRVVPKGVQLAETLPLGSFRRELRKLVEIVRVATLDERYREALKLRRVVVEPSVEGMAWVSIYMPAIEARASMNRLTALAKAVREREGETRTLDELRADIVGDLLVEGRTDGVPEADRGIHAIVTVTVPALSLLENGAAASGEPAVVEGIGPIPIWRARELCGGDPGWMRVLTHPESGTVLSVGRKKYKPPKSMQRFVRWRAGRCMGPGCPASSERCEIDHTVAWEDGGRTEVSNLGPLCVGHHTIKHHGGWQVAQVEGSGGAIEWTSPSGRRYVVEPERRLPVFIEEPSAADRAEQESSLETAEIDPPAEGVELAEMDGPDEDCLPF
ncbi:DUF222 domain-containing protein [Microbacterium sp. P05]|uniref:HNH endonuclease signature motif containing protein n=1 Tax=Microbacterium sp. P05 TaxID=3366948 RepID=UPI0037474180